MFITGASRGIGAACVKKFTDEGWFVVGFYNKTQKLENSNVVKYYQVDVGDPESVNKAFDTAFSEVGRIDCLVNNAGIVVDKKLVEYTMDDFKKIIQVNEMGVYVCTQKVLEKMGEGVIVNVSSTAAQYGSYDAIYGATKGAVLSFTKSMALELAPRIRVNCVAPGLTKTDLGLSGWKPEEFETRAKMIPLGKIAEASDVADGIYFLASDGAKHITGACLDINGGYVLR